VPFFTSIENLKGVIFSMTFTTKIEYSIDTNAIIEAKEGIKYDYKLGCLDAFCLVFDYINNSNSTIKPDEILNFIMHEMKRRGAYKIRIDVIDPKNK
jgi:hypothetical protein